MVAVFVTAGDDAHVDLTSSMESSPTEEPAQQPCGGCRTSPFAVVGNGDGSVIVAGPIKFDEAQSNAIDLIVAGESVDLSGVMGGGKTVTMHEGLQRRRAAGCKTVDYC